MKMFAIPAARRSPARVAAAAACLFALSGARASLAAEAVPLEDVEALTADQKVERSEAYVGDMRTMVRFAFSRLQESRDAERIDAVMVISDALTAMKGLLRLSEANLVALQEAAARRDADRLDHEFIKIVIAYNKMVELDAEVRSASGPDLSASLDGRATVEQLFDEDLPAVEVRSAVETPPIAAERPRSISESF